MQSPHGPPAPQCPCGGPQTRPGPPPGRSSDRGGRLLEAGAGRAAGDDGSGLNEHKEKRTEGSEGEATVNPRFVLKNSFVLKMPSVNQTEKQGDCQQRVTQRLDPPRSVSPLICLEEGSQSWLITG